MNIVVDSQTIRPDQNSETNVRVHIVGENRIQSELIALFLERKMPVACTRGSRIHFGCETLDPASGRQLVLLDCLGRKDFSPWSQYPLEGFLSVDGCFLIFYNVHPEAGIEPVAIDAGIRGIFYHHESINIFPKGLLGILGGELWFSRKVMSERLLSTKRVVFRTNESYEKLTRREKEILWKIAGGASNREISETLFISPNTVRSHIYSIHKKIRVENRFQATLWAVEHLQKETF